MMWQAALVWSHARELFIYFIPLLYHGCQINEHSEKILACGNVTSDVTGRGGAGVRRREGAVGRPGVGAVDDVID